MRFASLTPIVFPVVFGCAHHNGDLSRQYYERDTIDAGVTLIESDIHETGREVLSEELFFRMGRGEVMALFDVDTDQLSFEKNGKKVDESEIGSKILKIPAGTFTLRESIRVEGSRSEITGTIEVTRNLSGRSYVSACDLWVDVSDDSASHIQFSDDFTLLEFRGIGPIHTHQSVTSVREFCDNVWTYVKFVRD